MGIEMGKESETVKTFIVILLCAIAGHAQTAKVVALSREDSDKAIHLRAELDRAQKALDDFNQEVKDKYTSDLVEEKKDTCTSGTWTGFLTSATTICLVGPGCPEPTPEEKRKAKEAQDAYDARCIKTVKVPHVRYDWQNGFTYSDDFKYIVPAQSPFKPLQAGGIPYCQNYVVAN